jgi:hypothetical protein
MGGPVDSISLHKNVHDVGGVWLRCLVWHSNMVYISEHSPLARREFLPGKLIKFGPVPLCAIDPVSAKDVAVARAQASVANDVADVLVAVIIMLVGSDADVFGLVAKDPGASVVGLYVCELFILCGARVCKVSYMH